MLAATRALYDWLCGVAGRRLGMASHSTHFATQCAGPALNAWVASGMPGGGPAPPPTLPPPPGVIVPPGTPPWPGRILRQPPIMRGEDVRTWQRGAGGLATDGAYGPLSEGRCRQVQQAAGLPIDGRVGPNTWPATWRVGGATPPPTPPPSGAPPWPGRLLRNQAPMMNGADVRQYQQRMRDRGWQIAVDGWFGPQSAEITRQFQIRQRLQADSIVGPITWAAAFS
jgi:hypothetical protein